MKPVAVILAGGKGTRLWPLSRTYFPKPFIQIHGSKGSLFQDAVLRSLGFTDEDKIYVVVNEQHVPLVERQLGELDVQIPEEQILPEPAPRDTLPAMLYALLQIEGNPPIVMLPSDQYVKEEDVLAQLTDQQQKILELIAEGQTNREIAGQINLSDKTVKNYVSNILGKLEVSRRSQAAAFLAERRGRREYNS